MLSAADSMTDEYWSRFIDDKKFVAKFILLAGYSIKFSRSKKLLDMIPNSLGTSNVKRLKRRLSKRKLVTTEADSLKLWQYVVSALKKIELPRSLQDLSRRTINRAMSNRSLLGCTALGLPVHLEAYVLHQ